MPAKQTASDAGELTTLRNHNTSAHKNFYNAFEELWNIVDMVSANTVDYQCIEGKKINARKKGVAYKNTNEKYMNALHRSRRLAGLDEVSSEQSEVVASARADVDFWKAWKSVLACTYLSPDSRGDIDNLFVRSMIATAEYVVFLTACTDSGMVPCPHSTEKPLRVKQKDMFKRTLDRNAPKTVAMKAAVAGNAAASKAAKLGAAADKLVGDMLHAEFFHDEAEADAHMQHAEAVFLDSVFPAEEQQPL